MNRIEPIGESREISAIYDIADVKEIRPDLTESQAWEALKLAWARNNPGIVITLDAIDAAANMLYGWPPLHGEAEGGGHVQ
jgi:hypothetical protein